MNQGVRRAAGGRVVARAQAWLQELVPLVAGQFHPHLAKAVDLGCILGPFLRSQEASSQAPPPSSCQEMTGGLGMRAALPLPPRFGQLGGGGCYSPAKGPVQESGDLIPPGSGLCSRLGVGELGVRVPLAWSPSGSPAGQSEEGELDSAQLVSQTQLSCSCLEVLSFFPNVPQMLLALSHQQFAVIPRCNHTCPQAVPRCMARPVRGLNIPLIPGVGGAISRFSEVPESPGQWGRKSGWELKREHKAVFVKLGH